MNDSPRFTLTEEHWKLLLEALDTRAQAQRELLDRHLHCPPGATDFSYRMWRALLEAEKALKAIALVEDGQSWPASHADLALDRIEAALPERW